MKSILADALSCELWLDGKRYRIQPTVERVLLALDDLDNPLMLDADRIRLAVWRLYRWPRPKPSPKAVDAVFELINEKSPYKATEQIETLSLEQDAALICAAFRQLYGINLPDEAATMDWRYFQALLSGISDSTVLGEIMGIRAMKLPKRTATNSEYIRDIQKQKAQYALRKKVSKGISFDSGLRGMAEMLMAMAERK